MGGAHGYVPTPVNIGWEIYAGAIAGVIPFAIGSYQFIARIVSHAQCIRAMACCNCFVLLLNDANDTAT